MSLLAHSLHDTSDDMGVVQVRQSCCHLQDVIRTWAESKTGSSDGISAAHAQLKRDFAEAKTKLSTFVMKGDYPSDWVPRGSMTAGGFATVTSAGIDSGYNMGGMNGACLGASLVAATSP